MPGKGKPGLLIRKGTLAQRQSRRPLISRFRVLSPGGLLTRRWRNGQRISLLTRRLPVRIRGGALTLRWSKRTSHQALNLETAGSSPARSTRGPIVYGLGSWPFKPWNRVRLPAGSPRVRWSSTTPGFDPEAACESGSRRPSGVVQWAGPVAVNHVISVRVTAPEPR